MRKGDPPDWLEEAALLARSRAQRMPPEDMARLLQEAGPPGTTVRPARGARGLVVDNPIEQRVLHEPVVHPSWFGQYRYCGRKLALRIAQRIRGEPEYIPLDRARALAEGVLLHRLYAERTGNGPGVEAEVPVEARVGAYKVVGVADIVEMTPGGTPLAVREVKKRPVTRGLDPLATALQATAYARALEAAHGLPQGSVQALVVTPDGVWEARLPPGLLEEYMKRLRTVVEAAARGLSPPPRLGRDLRRRCESCDLRALCSTIPDPWRGDWNAYLRETGASTRPRERRPSLADFMRGPQPGP